MTNDRSMLTHLVLAAALALALQPGRAAAADEESAKMLARQSGCFKCHAVSKKKEGPAWQSVAAKYKGKPEAHARLVKHLTTGEKAKFEDGHTEDHAIIKSKDPAAINNLVDWILSL